MYYYSKKSNRKVVHLSHCCYFHKIQHRAYGVFHTLEEAHAAGYRLCKHCAPMGKYYRREHSAMCSFAVENGLNFAYQDGVIDIATPLSAWRIITNGKQHKIFLYHKNTQVRKRDTSIISGYHSQAYRSATVLGYMQYIVQHDAYRANHPLVNPGEVFARKEKSEPKKGVRGYRKKLKKWKRSMNHLKACRVIELLEQESCRCAAV